MLQGAHLHHVLDQQNLRMSAVAVIVHAVQHSKTGKCPRRRFRASCATTVIDRSVVVSQWFSSAAQQAYLLNCECRSVRVVQQRSAARNVVCMQQLFLTIKLH